MEAPQVNQHKAGYNRSGRIAIILVTVLMVACSDLFADTQLKTSDFVQDDTILVDNDLFSETGPLSITLAYNIRDFIRNKFSDEYIDARLVIHINDTLNTEHNVRIKPRGNNRREVCYFPPLWINIRDANIDNSYLQDIVRLKFVTHCANSSNNLNYVLKEYLAYRIYNIISPYSFRVRLVKVKYIDTGRNNRELDAWGFMIEPEEMLAQRIKAFPVENDRLGYRHTDGRETDIMTVFQYLIGNADYSVTGRQNIKLFKLDDYSRPLPVPVPYDFDYAGFVNAGYAIPGENLGIFSVTERYFLGPCRTEERYSEVIDYFLSRKDDIYSLVESFEYLDRKPKGVSARYLDGFFQNCKNQDYIKNNFLSTCRDTTAN